MRHFNLHAICAYIVLMMYHNSLLVAYKLLYLGIDVTNHAQYMKILNAAFEAVVPLIYSQTDLFSAAIEAVLVVLFGNNLRKQLAALDYFHVVLLKKLDSTTLIDLLT